MPCQDETSHTRSLCTHFSSIVSTLSVEYKSTDHAKIAMNSLCVDKELSPEKVFKKFAIEENRLVM